MSGMESKQPAFIVPVSTNDAEADDIIANGISCMHGISEKPSDFKDDSKTSI